MKLLAPAFAALLIGSVATGFVRSQTAGAIDSIQENQANRQAQLCQVDSSFCKG